VNASLDRPLVLGIGGSTSAQSSTARALRVTMAAAEAAGARTRVFTGGEIATLPWYAADATEPVAAARELVEAVRAADAIVFASHGYHGTLAGVFKNAVDYLEELRDDARPYLSGRAVGCIAVSAGWQAAVTTLSALRSLTHALRGWPTPLGAAINSAGPVFDASGACVDEHAASQLEGVGVQVVRFAAMQRQMPQPL
jgi:FMN reductase